MTSPLPAYAVPGIDPKGGSSDPRSVTYTVDQLAHLPPVAEARSRTPDVLSAIRLDNEDRDTFATSRDDLCAQLWVGTNDGLNWSLVFGDGINFLIGIGRKYSPNDLLAEALAAQPDVQAVQHVEREAFEVQTAEVLRADEVAARWLDAVVSAHRAYARFRDIALPY
jgi:hypothetical protein